MSPDRVALARAVCAETARRCDGGSARESVACARAASHNPTVVGWPIAERIAFGPDAWCARDPRTGAWSYVHPSAPRPRAPARDEPPDTLAAGLAAALLLALAARARYRRR